MSFHSLSELNPLSVLEKFTGSTLILPIVSIGNVPQLTVDLLIYNLPGVKLVGRLDSTWIYPFSAAPDYTEDANGTTDDTVNSPVSTCTGLEVYYCSQYNLTIIQQRSPIISGCSQRFYKDLLVPFVELCEFKNVLVLQSRDKGFREDKYAKNDFQLWTNDLAKNLAISLNIHDDSRIASMSKCEDISPCASYLFEELFSELAVAVKRTKNEESQQLSGSTDMARSTSNLFMLINSARTMELGDIQQQKAKDTKDNKIEPLGCACLSTFVYEGDNSKDAEQFYDCVLKVLGIVKSSGDRTKLVAPKSWKGVYGGNLLPTGMEYGLYA